MVNAILGGVQDLKLVASDIKAGVRKTLDVAEHADCNTTVIDASARRTQQHLEGRIDPGF